MTRAGIFGPSQSGKTTLAKSISRQYWLKKNVPTLAFAPMDASGWGNQAWVTKDEEKFWDAVKKKRECLVIVDDASVTIRRERKLIGMFTTLNHQGHRLITIGHTASDLVPAMRKQIEEIYLFWQDEDEAKTWERLFPRSHLSFAFHLQQFEFLRNVRFGKTTRNKLTI